MPSSLAMLSEEELDLLHVLRRTVSHQKPLHHNPADYGLTQEEADKMRLRYLMARRKEYLSQAMFFHNNAIHPSAKKDSLWFLEWQFNYWNQLLIKIEQQILMIRNKKKKSAALDSFDILTLKAIPIENFVDVNPNNGSFKLRDEKTPSAHLYRAQNRWYDFGSGEGGDVIDLIMKLQDCSFMDACKFLANK